MFKPLYLVVLILAMAACQTYVDPTPTQSPFTPTYPPNTTPTPGGPTPIAPLQATLTGEGFVEDVLWFDDTLVVVAQYGVWLYRPDQEPHPIGEHYNAVHVAAFNTDGTLLASSTKSYLPFEPSIIRIWDLENGGVQAVVELALGQVEAMAFSPGSALLASGGTDATLYEWDVITGSQVRTYTTQTKTIRALAYSPDGRWLVAGAEHVLRIERQGEHVETLNGLDNPIALAFSPDSHLLASVNPTGSLVVWDISTGDIISRTTYPALKLAFIDDQTLMLNSHDETALYNVPEQRIVAVRAGRYWNPNLNLYARFENDTLQLINADDTPRATYPYRLITPPPSTPAALPTPYAVSFEVRSVVTHNNWLVVMGGTGRRGDARIQVIDTETGQTIKRHTGIHDYYIDVAAINADATRLLTGGADNRVLLWSLPDLQPLAILGKLSAPIVYVTFTDEGYLVISADGTQRTGPLPE